MKIEDMLISSERSNYKCYDELKKLLNDNKQFKEAVIDGVLQGQVAGFDEELWRKIHDQNIRGIANFEDVFRDGANIGYCTVASKQLSYSLNKPFICGGVLPIIEGTKNSPDGSHTWIFSEGKVIDTTLMLVMDPDFASRVGYIEENRYDPSIDAIYMATREFTLDSSLKPGK